MYAVIFFTRVSECHSLKFDSSVQIVVSIYFYYYYLLFFAELAQRAGEETVTQLARDRSLAGCLGAGVIPNCCLICMAR